MENNFLKKSDDANVNYLAIVSKITNIKPIENADRLCTTVLNGYDIIVQNTTKIGDIVIFFPQESCICEQFLSANNQYGISDYDLNSNADEIKALLDASLQATNEEDKNEIVSQAKAKVGFFNRYGRVTMLKLRGAYSFGFVIPINSMEIAFPELQGVDWEPLVGTEFNVVNDTLFCWKYIPRVKEKKTSANPNGSRRHRYFQKKMVRFDRIIPDNFTRHYETTQIEKSIRDIKPDDVITVNVKLHGFSGIFANVECNRKLSWFEKIKKFFGCKVQLTEYGNVYSSRNVIKNRYINKNVTNGFYGKDTWSPVNEMLKPFLKEGMTVYGEIVGYIEGTDMPIQKKHDYGCQIGEWKFLPYRISTIEEDGKKREWNVMEVDEWTRNIVKEHPELSHKIMFFEMLYHGKFCDLYPELDVNSETWYDDVLMKMKNEKRWLMEEKEPLCHNLDRQIAEVEHKISLCKSKKTIEYKELQKQLTKLKEDEAPREGVVIRIDNDIFPRAWKLKTAAHYALTKKQNDNGEIDMEDMESIATE